MPNQHKQIQYEVCDKWMRKDNLRSHSNIHKDLLDLPEEEIKTKLKRRHVEKVERKEKRQKVIAIAENLNLSIPEELILTSAEDETLLLMVSCATKYLPVGTFLTCFEMKLYLFYFIQRKFIIMPFCS